MSNKRTFIRLEEPSRTRVDPGVLLGVALGAVVVLLCASQSVAAGQRVTCEEVLRVRAAVVEMGMEDASLRVLQDRVCQSPHRPIPGDPPPVVGGVVQTPPPGTDGWRYDEWVLEEHTQLPEECLELETVEMLYRVGGEKDVSRQFDALHFLMCELKADTRSFYGSGEKAKGALGWNWKNGEVATRSYGWNFPNGKGAIRAFGYNWPNGKTAKRSFGWNYPNGKKAKRSHGWSLPDGRRSGTEADVIAYACQRVTRKKCRRQVRRIEALSGTAREAAVVGFVWQASQVIDRGRR